MVDTPEVPKRTPRDKAATLVQMAKEAQRVERRTGAASCIIICLFEEDNQLQIQDAGRFPMPPDQFYNIMIQAHQNGQLGHNSPKNKSRIIKPH